MFFLFFSPPCPCAASTQTVTYCGNRQVLQKVWAAVKSMLLYNWTEKPPNKYVPDRLVVHPSLKIVLARDAALLSLVQMEYMNNYSIIKHFQIKHRAVSVQFSLVFWHRIFKTCFFIIWPSKSARPCVWGGGRGKGRRLNSEQPCWDRVKFKVTELCQRRQGQMLATVSLPSHWSS